MRGGSEVRKEFGLQGMDGDALRVCSHVDGRAWDKGQEVDWEEADALRMIERGYAERVHAPQRK